MCGGAGERQRWRRRSRREAEVKERGGVGGERWRCRWRRRSEERGGRGSDAKHQGVGGGGERGGKRWRREA